MFPDPTARSQRTNALADDERFIQRSKEVPARAGFLFYVIHKLLVEDFHFHFCPKARELWLRILEGKTDDDVWLWVEGDEEWLRENPVPYRETTRMNAWSLSESDLVDAQSALRCRVAKQRYPTVTGRHGSRNERVYNATPAQRVCAIAWIIAGSRGVGELFASHGRTPPTFRPPRIADILSHIVGECWDAFSAQTSTWDNALAKSKEDGCICSPVASRGMKQWFNMMVWLEDTPPTLEVGYKPCARCRSLLESRYEVIVAERTEVLHVSLLNALLAYYSRSFSTHESPTAESLVTRKLEPLMEKHRPDLRYLPCVNKYPHSLREHVAKQFCKWKNNDFPAVRFPDHILDGAHDRWVVLGIIALTTYRDPAGKETYLHDKDRDLHAKGWHDLFSSRVRASRDCFSLPLLPRLSATSVRLCHELDQDYSEQRLFDPFSADMGGSDWVYPDRDRRQLRLSTAVFVAVATFLWDKDVDLHGCRRCQNICKEFLADTSSSGALGGANSGEREGLRSPSLPTRGEGDALGRDQALPLNGSLQVRMLEPAGIEVFTSMLHHSTLSKDEKQSRLVWGLHKLKQCGDSLGLNMSDYFQLCLEESAPPSRSPEQGTSSSSKLSKSDKIEQIKDRLLDMLSKGTRFTLRALAMVYSRERPREKWVHSDQLAEWSSPEARE
ncbi:hypothetical protein EDC04DRAFT_1540002 [Pisolithus marmoratus]|nr:hypothetical protein EDC04DRAFT_1540002 [Pisolithus marmoratus]